MKKILIFLALISIAFTLKSSIDQSLVDKYRISVLQDGDGVNYPQSGTEVDMHMIGYFADTGKEFDRFAAGVTHKTKLGTNFVIKCWDEVLLYLSQGEKVKVFCPSETAYGARGIEGIIPPNKDLEYELTQVKVYSPENYDL